MPHIHWYKATTSSAIVDWQLKYKWASIGEVLPDWSELVEGVETHNSNTAFKHSLTTFGTIDGTGKTLSSMLCLYLTRLGTGTTDTYTGDAHLMEIDLHYEVDGFGSDDEYLKEE